MKNQNQKQTTNKNFQELLSLAEIITVIIEDRDNKYVNENLTLNSPFSMFPVKFTLGSLLKDFTNKKFVDSYFPMLLELNETSNILDVFTAMCFNIEDSEKVITAETFQPIFLLHWLEYLRGKMGMGLLSQLERVNFTTWLCHFFLEESWWGLDHFTIEGEIKERINYNISKVKCSLAGQSKIRLATEQDGLLKEDIKMSEKFKCDVKTAIEMLTREKSHIADTLIITVRTTGRDHLDDDDQLQDQRHESPRRSGRYAYSARRDEFSGYDIYRDVSKSAEFIHYNLEREIARPKLMLLNAQAITLTGSGKSLQADDLVEIYSVFDDILQIIKKYDC